MPEHTDGEKNSPEPLLDALRAAWADSSVTLHADAFDQETIQWLFTTALKTFVAKCVSDGAFGPFGEHPVNATEVVATATAMLEEANIEIFELTLWTGLGTL